MFSHDPYMAKSLEYLVGLASLGLFIWFWRFVNGGPVEVFEHAKAFAGQLSEWFRMPVGVSFHPGHAWVRREAPGVVAIGMDDFAQQLVGPVSGLQLPKPGTTLREGLRAWALDVDNKQIEMLAPATGTVIAVNDDLVQHPDLVNTDPYGRGWLVKLRVQNLAETLSPLNAGARAKAWMDGVSKQLTAAMSPELGQLCQDGGMPVHGFARSIDEEHWDDVARTFLLTRPELHADADADATAAATDDARSGSMQVSTRVVTMLMIVAVSAWGVTVAAQSMSRLPDELTMTQSADSPGPVAFRHATHVDSDKPNCTSCHPREFRILKANAGTAPAIRHDNMEKGRQCGACHDGKKAFAMDDCTSCHTAP